MAVVSHQGAMSGFVGQPMYNPNQGRSGEPMKEQERSEIQGEDMNQSYIALLASVMGLIAALLTAVLGFMQIFVTSVHLQWPDQFLDDVNAESWRQRMFTFSPNTLIDVWTPMVWGMVSFSFHVGPYPALDFLHSNFLLYTVWNVVQALWANFGYAGGLGIIIGVVSLLAALLSLLTYLISPSASVSLLIDMRRRPALEGQKGVEDGPYARSTENGSGESIEDMCQVPSVYQAPPAGVVTSYGARTPVRSNFPPTTPIGHNIRPGPDQRGSFTSAHGHGYVARNPVWYTRHSAESYLPPVERNYPFVAA